MTNMKETQDNSNPQPGQVYEDSMFGSELEIKYSDEDVVLVCDADGNNHLYNRDEFNLGKKRTLMQTENRFTLVNNG